MIQIGGDGNKSSRSRRKGKQACCCFSQNQVREPTVCAFCRAADLAARGSKCRQCKFSALGIGTCQRLQQSCIVCTQNDYDALTASQHMAGVAKDHKAADQADLTDIAGQVLMQPRLKLLSCGSWRSSCSRHCAVKLTGAASPHPVTLELPLSELLLISRSSCCTGDSVCSANALMCSSYEKFQWAHRSSQQTAMQLACRPSSLCHSCWTGGESQILPAHSDNLSGIVVGHLSLS